MEARWLHSRKAGEEKKDVDVHDVAHVLVQCGFDAAIVMSLGDAVHAVAVLYDALVLGQRPTRVQDHFYWCEIQALRVKQSEMGKAWQEGI